MPDEPYHWEDYYKKVMGRETHPLLIDAVKRFQTEAFQGPRLAIDLGCGDGTETVTLLEHGWNVMAVDGEPAAIQWLLAKTPDEFHPYLQTQVAKFEDVVLPAADLVHSSYSLPFCKPEDFDALWKKIRTCLNTGGRFAGQFFGVNDSWADNPDMTFHTEEQVRGMFEEFEIESFHEQDEDGEAASGPKHWHIFTVIARKRYNLYKQTRDVMAHPNDTENVEVKESPIEGLGVFVTRDFRAGEQIRRVIIVREITEANPLREAEGERHEHCAYPDGKVVLWGFPDRHVNHSCNPNAYERHEHGEVTIVARKDISAGEEVTFDYNTNTAGGTSWPCNCGAKRCRGETIGDFFLLPEEIQIEYRSLLADWFVATHHEKIAQLDEKIARKH